MKIAILGTGFIGLNLLDVAIRKGFLVSVLSRHPCPKKYDKPSIDMDQGLRKFLSFIQSGL
jgi:hypothetical protein